MSSYEVDGRRIAVDYADAVGTGGEGKKERRSQGKPRRDFSPREGKSKRSFDRREDGAFDKYKGKKKKRW